MYYLSVLSTFKNETMNLKIWLEHYIWQGVEHFYLIDNDSNDNPLEILQPYIDKGIVTYYYKPEKYMQDKNYRWVFDNANLKRATHWLAICDLDEFFFGVDKKLSTKLKTLEYYNIISSNWVMFGTDGLIEHPNDIRTAIVHKELSLNNYTKIIFKPLSINNSSQIEIHGINHPITNTPIASHPKMRIANQLIRLHHYPIQSEEFFYNIKATRGDGVHSHHEYTRNATYFTNYTKNCTHKDDTLKQLIENPPTNYLV